MTCASGISHFIACSVVMLSACSEPGIGDAAALEELRTFRGDTVVVTHVRGQQWVRDGVLEEVVRIGTSDGADEYLFGRVNSIAARGTGPVYVYDDQFHQLRMYDSSGTYVRQVGRVGRGPGEYQYIIGLSVLTDGRLAAWDARQNRINLFTAAGDRIDEFQLLLGGGLFTAKVFDTDTANTFYVLTLSRARLRTLHVDMRGQVVDTLKFPPGNPFQGMDRVHAQLSRQLHHHGYFVWGNSDRYVIHARTVDGRLLQIERRIAPIAFSAAERAGYQATLDSSARREREDERPRGEFGVVPEWKPFFEDIRVSTDGGIWVLRQRATAAAEPELAFDVFDVRGSFLGSVPVPRNASIEVIDGEHVWGTVKDADGVEAVVRWRLRVHVR